VRVARRRVLEARQFGLKDLANVTYGYTAASFSGDVLLFIVTIWANVTWNCAGRMPCAELADAVVMLVSVSLCTQSTMAKASFCGANLLW